MGQILQYVIFLFVSISASIVGAICGIGGGIIIKPVLDVFKVASTSTISFLSGFTVLSMSAYSLIAAKQKGESYIRVKHILPLALGAAFGGLLGKMGFSYLKFYFSNDKYVGAVQAVFMILLSISTLIYVSNKKKIHTHQMQNPLLSSLIGLLLGILSSFLGIGGGPINLILLHYAFSMDIKTAAQNSLYIILISQIFGIIYVILSGTIPSFPLMALAVMAFGGIMGGIIGRAQNKKMSLQAVDKLFWILMNIIIIISLFNVYQYLF